MALDSSSIIIPGRGTVLIANVDTPPINFDKFDLTKANTYTGWTISHTSSDDAVELSKDGGDATQFDTWEQDAVRTTYAATTITWTASKLQLDQDTFAMAFGGGANTWDAATKSYKVSELLSTEKAATIIMIDGTGARGGVYFPRNSIALGDMPKVDPAKMLEINISATVLASANTGIRMQWFGARPYTPAP